MTRYLFPTFLLLLTFFTQSTFAQMSEEYSAYIQKGNELYDAKDYRASAENYEKAFAANDDKGYINDRYNAAYSWALAGEPGAAFKNLFRISESGHYTNYDHLISDSDLHSLHDDPRWAKVCELVKANKEKAEANLDKELVAILDEVYETDQEPRRRISEVQEKYGRDSEEMQALWKEIINYDSINTIKVTQILDEHGWLGSDVIGGKGNSALFLVIQHADLDIQLKYLPMMREAVEKGNARASSLALLEDRVSLRQGNLQIYGSQIGYDEESGESYVLPLEDPDQVDERRAQMGLGPLAEYTARFNFEWDVEVYKKKLPEYIKKQQRW